MKIIRTGAYENFYDMPLSVNWILTTKCNYRCSYCFEYGKGKPAPQNHPFTSLSQFKAAVDNIVSLNRPWYNVTLSGGEPTIHPHIFELITMLNEKLDERLNRILIITNGSRNKKLYGQIADMAKSVSIDICISIHTDHVDMEHILELIETLSSDIDLKFSLMFNPAKREEVHLIYDILFEYRKRFEFELNIILIKEGDEVDSRHTPEDFAWQKKAIEQFDALIKSVAYKFPQRKKHMHLTQIFHEVSDNGAIRIMESKNRPFDLATGLLKFTNMYCIAHAAVLRIEENGLCRGMVCNADPFICNIYEENSIQAVRDNLIHAVQCPKQNCGCSANDRIPKFAFPQEAAKFIEIVKAKQQALFAEYAAIHSERKF